MSQVIAISLVRFNTIDTNVEAYFQVNDDQSLDDIKKSVSSHLTDHKAAIVQDYVFDDQDENDLGEPINNDSEPLALNGFSEGCNKHEAARQQSFDDLMDFIASLSDLSDLNKFVHVEDGWDDEDGTENTSYLRIVTRSLSEI